MTTDKSRLTSEAALNDELRALLQQAHENGVDVEGGWECRNGSKYPDWDIVVSEVEKPDDGE